MDSKLLREFEAFLEWKNAHVTAQPTTTVNELLDMFVPAFTATGKSSARVLPTVVKTLRITRVPLSGVPTPLGEWPIASLNRGAAADYRGARAGMLTKRNKPPCPTYVTRELTALHGALKYAVDRELLRSNPISGWERTGEEQYARQTYVTPDMFERLVAHAHPLLQDILTVQYRCVGMRPTEARLLRKDEVHLDASPPHILLAPGRTKNKKTYPIPVPAAAAEVLRRNMEASRGPYVFVRPTDPQRMRELSYNTFAHWVVAARNRAGLHGVNGEQIVSYHLRHAGISDTLSNGAPSEHVSKAARVSPKVMARTYVKFAPEQQSALLSVLERHRSSK